MSGQATFRDLRIEDGIFGMPELVALDANTFFVSDWRGAVRKVDWLAGTVERSPTTAILKGMVGSQLRSLCVDKVNYLIGTATTAPWAEIWDLNAGSMDKVHSESGRTVNSVTFSPNGKYLALGTGFYPLDPSHRIEAEVEVWAHEEEWNLKVVAALPGVCVDWLVWHETSDALVALTGRRAQDGGYTCFLDGSNLRPRRIADRKGLPGHVCGMQEWPPAVAVFGEDLTMFHLDSSEEDTSCTPQQPLDGACLDGEFLLTTSGHFVDRESGDVAGELAPLKDCCRVAVRPGGGHIGIASNGVLRVWEPPV